MLEYSSRALLQLAITLSINMTVGVLAMGLQVYCRKEYFNATCPHDSVILMKHAQYGRMRQNRCVESAHNLRCGADVLKELDARCSGRQNCVIKLPDDELQAKQTCPKDTIGYLEAEYTCMKVAQGSGRSCADQGSVEISNSQSGYIASSSTALHGFGSSRCPWVIHMAKGQRINITLLDFGVTSRQRKPGNTCFVYAKIQESEEENSPVTICGSGDRMRPVFISSENRVTIQVTPVQALDMAEIRFLLKYEAVGCTDPVIPPGGYATRTGDQAVVACRHGTPKWHIVCHKNTWSGGVQNCTEPDLSVADNLSDSRDPFPLGLLIAVITGIILGVLIGILMLAVVFCVQKRRRQSKGPTIQGGPPHLHSTDYMTGQDSPFLEKSPPSDPGYGYTHVWPGIKTMHPHVSQDELSPATKDLLAREGTLKSLGKESQVRHGGHHGYEKPGAFTVEVRLGAGSGGGNPHGGGGIDPAGCQIPMYHEFDHNTLDSMTAVRDPGPDVERHLCHPCDLHGPQMPR